MSLAAMGVYISPTTEDNSSDGNICVIDPVYVPPPNRIPREDRVNGVRPSATESLSFSTLYSDVFVRLRIRPAVNDE